MRSDSWWFDIDPHPTDQSDQAAKVGRIPANKTTLQTKHRSHVPWSKLAWTMVVPLIGILGTKFPIAEKVC